MISIHPSRSRVVRVSDLLLVHVLLLLLPLEFALLLLESEALVLKLHLLELGIALLGHLILQHAAHAVHGKGLLSVGPIGNGLTVAINTFLPQTQHCCSSASRASAPWPIISGCQIDTSCGPGKLYRNFTVNSYVSVMWVWNFFQKIQPWSPVLDSL